MFVYICFALSCIPLSISPNTTQYHIHTNNDLSTIYTHTHSGDGGTKRERETEDTESGLGSPMPPAPTLDASEGGNMGDIEGIEGGLPLVRQLSLPGARFRQHHDFLEMQVEVDEEKDLISSQLIRFARQNKVLLNMILKGNVHLLESTFR